MTVSRRQIEPVVGHSTPFYSVPARWVVVAFKRLAKLKYGDSLVDVREQRKGEFPIYGSNGLLDWCDRYNASAPCIVVGRKGSAGRINWVDSPCYVSDTALYIDEPSPKVLLRWLYYVLMPMRLETRSEDSAVPGLARELVESQSVPLPPLKEQREIVRFLDEETAKIDALIANKDKMIERLEEHRRAFITTTVSVGLENTEYEATDSQFAPSIPKSWRLMRLCHVVERIVDTEHATAPVAEGGHYLVVRTSNVREGELRFEGARYTDEESFKRWTRRGLPMPGDVLFTREAPAGEACVVPSDVDLCIGQRMVLLKVNRRLTSAQWIVHSIESGPAQSFIDLLSRSTTVAHLNMRDIPNIPIVLPPIDVQSDLLDAIADEVSRVQPAKRCLVEQVQILKEHRRALITAAVTGQIDVGSAA